MDKPTYNALERLLEAEIDAAVAGGLGIVQSKAKIFRKLAEQGMAEEKMVVLSGRFPVRIKGYALTLKGHFAFSQEC